jgi:hypothetical protein
VPKLQYAALNKTIDRRPRDLSATPALATPLSNAFEEGTDRLSTLGGMHRFRAGILHECNIPVLARYSAGPLGYRELDLTGGSHPTHRRRLSKNSSLCPLWRLNFTWRTSVPFVYKGGRLHKGLFQPHNSQDQDLKFLNRSGLNITECSHIILSFSLCRHWG